MRRTRKRAANVDTVIGDQLRSSIGTSTGSGIALIVGLLGALWGGMGAVYVNHVVQGAGKVYGTFAVVLGLSPGSTSKPSSPCSAPNSTWFANCTSSRAACSDPR